MIDPPLHSGVRKLCGIHVDSPMTDERAQKELEINYWSTTLDRAQLLSEDENVAVTAAYRQLWENFNATT